MDRVVDFVMLVLVDNRAYPMFAVLFGFGLATIARRMGAHGDDTTGIRSRIRRRGAWLLVFGAVHNIVLGGADILGFYGLMALLVAGLAARRERALNHLLVWMGATYMVLIPAVWIAIGRLAGFGLPLASYGTYLTGVVGRAQAYPAEPLLPIIMWPMAFCVVLGIWFERSSLVERLRERRGVVRIAVAVGVTISVLGAVPGALIGTGVWQPTPLAGGVATAVHVLTGVAGGLGYAALFWGIAGAFQARQTSVVRALAALGQRSLTFYVFQETLLFWLMSQTGLALGAAMSSGGAAVVAACVWTVGLVLALLLASRGWRGPLDELLRRLARGSASQTRQAAGR